MPSAVKGYRQLGRTVGSAAVPYGYTLGVWGGGTVAIHAFGPPSLIDALLFVAGGTTRARGLRPDFS